METKITKTKPNLFDPVLSSNAYTGHIKENERIVKIEPNLHASDADPLNSPNGLFLSNSTISSEKKFFFFLGKICGYELSLHKHDDPVDTSSENILFLVELGNEQAVIKVKTTIDKLDCEVKQTYRLFIRAYDCAKDEKRRYSER
jgi:hypothetical protein